MIFFYPHLTIRGDYLQERMNRGELVELKKKLGGDDVPPRSWRESLNMHISCSY